MTYPHPKVQEFLRENLVGLKVNEKETSPPAIDVMRKHRLLWSPGYVILSSRGEELRRFLGYRPVEEFLQELDFALGLDHTLHARHAEAFHRFRSAYERSPESDLAPEALYWAGIAAFRRDGRRLETLKSHWQELAERFPKSSWWQRADVFDVDPVKVFGNSL